MTSMTFTLLCNASDYGKMKWRLASRISRVSDLVVVGVVLHTELLVVDNLHIYLDIPPSWKIRQASARLHTG